MDDLPVRPGTYALILGLAKPRPLTIGRLGSFELPAGIYIYLGSARGPGGIRARLGRHLRGTGRSHWHIDYLRAVTVVKGYAFRPVLEKQYGHPPLECHWSQALAAQAGASILVPGFGASDCNSGCPAHLLQFPTSDASTLSELISKMQPTFERARYNICDG